MRFRVPGMMCMHCVKSVKDALSEMDGVFDVQVDLSTKEVTLQANEELKKSIVSSIEDLGFDVE